MAAMISLARCSALISDGSSLHRSSLSSSGAPSLGFPLQMRPATLVAMRAATSAKPKTKPAVAPAPTFGAEKEKPMRGITKPQPVSPALQALVGVPEIPRTQALKLIWAYIKDHNLQDPENKKIIVCDDKLKEIFGGRERVGFLEVTKLINPHFAKYKVIPHSR